MAASTHLTNVTSLGLRKIDETTMQVLRETLYPGAKDESIAMVINYCAARKLDPIKKPVHLVPMSVKSGKKDSGGKDIYEYRDVVMPGIGLYRIEADRSGQYAGMSEPEFGEDVEEVVGTRKITYPKYCRITVFKNVGDRNVGFTAKEFWKENYATKSRQDNSPNAMWEKRPYGQLAKCAEAQALRKAFPDVVGCDYTREEMEGKSHPENEKVIASQKKDDLIISDFNNFMYEIETCETENQLKEVFLRIKKTDFSSSPDNFKKLIDAKDAKKNELLVKNFKSEMEEAEKEIKEEEKINQSTGEIN